jgi:putative flavoprotein involved in K+ transport
MPEMHFLVEWPNGERETLYSPSYVVDDHLTVGQDYPISDFLERVGRALRSASDRVEARYGFACSSALDQLRAIEAVANGVSPTYRDGRVKVLAFDKHPPRDARAAGETGGETAGEHHRVVVVGAGQAGLSISYCLQQRGIEHVVLEKSRVANSWRTQRWDTFCLVTPNWQCRLPGHPYRGGDHAGFMNRDQIVEYLESYAASFGPPLREGVKVLSVSRRAGPTPGGQGRGSEGEALPPNERVFDIRTSTGTMTADQVVVATGSYHVTKIPVFEDPIPRDIMQVHSADYRNPGSLPEGDVLVVGSGQSGCQIAEDLHLAGRRVHLCVGNAPRCARRHRGKDVVEWLDQMGYYDIPIDRHPNREQVRDKTNHYVTGRGGGRDIDLRKFALAGMKLYGPLASVRGSVVELAPGLKKNLDDADDVYRSINRTIDAFIDKQGIEAPREPEYTPPWAPAQEAARLDLRAANVRSIVWCIGFGADFRWLDLPVFDASGYPRHERGVTEVAGLYFIGLPWLFTWGSGRFSGVARDAEHIVDRIEHGVFARADARANVEIHAASV